MKKYTSYDAKESQFPESSQEEEKAKKGADLLPSPEAYSEHEGEIAELEDYFDSEFGPHGLKSPYYRILPGENMDQPVEYKPFFDYILLSEDYFDLENEEKRVVAAYEYVKGLLNPISYEFKKENPEFVEQLDSFFEKWRDGDIGWEVPHDGSGDSDIDEKVQKMWQTFRVTESEGSISEDQISITNGARMLENAWGFIQNSPDSRIDSLVPNDVSEEDRQMYLTMLVCALGEKLEKDFRSNNRDSDQEMGVCEYFIKETRGVSIEENKEEPSKKVIGYADKLESGKYKFNKIMNSILDEVNNPDSDMDLNELYNKAEKS